MKRTLIALGLCVVLALTLAGCLLQDVIDNLDPVAAITYTVSDGMYTFSASKSIDPDGKIKEYAWYFGDGQSMLGEIVPHKYTNAGSYLVTLVIFDNDNGSDEATKWVHVTIEDPVVPVDPITPASAIIIVATASPLQSNSDVAFSGLTSVGRDNANIVECTWIFGDRNRVSGNWDAPYGISYSEVEHEYKKAGDYLVTLMIVDRLGYEDTTSITITIE